MTSKLSQNDFQACLAWKRVVAAAENASKEIENHFKSPTVLRRTHKRGLEEIILVDQSPRKKIIDNVPEDSSHPYLALPDLFQAQQLMNDFINLMRPSSL